MKLVELQQVLGDRITISLNKNLTAEERQEENEQSYLIMNLGKQMINNADLIEYHRYLYLQEHGEIPEGFSVIFADGDNRNFEIENLIAVPTLYQALINNTLKVSSGDTEVMLTAIEWCKLYEELCKTGMIKTRKDKAYV